MKITIQTKGVNNLTKKFRAMGPQRIEKEFSIIDREVIKAVEEEAPVKTGRLKKALRIRRTGHLRYEVSNPTDYDIMVQEGTKSHPIYPSKKKALYWPGAAHPVKMVNHPGTKPNRYMARGLQRALHQMGPTLNRIAGGIVRFFEQ